MALKVSAEQVYDAIKASNPTTFPQVELVDLVYGTPAVLSGDPSNKDTSLLVSAAINTPYIGDVTVKYNRLDLADFETNYGERTLIVPEGATAADVVAAFNSEYGAELTTDDYEDNALPTPPDWDGETYTLVAAAGSLAYKNEVVLNVALATTPLSTIIATTTLDGLYFPEV